MEKKYVDLANIRIAYFDNGNLNKPAIVFLHGNSQSAENAWGLQLGDEGLNQFRLIAFDLPAHGLSGITATPEKDLTFTGIGKIMAEALHQIGLDQFVLGGLSIGTNIVMEMLAYLAPKGLFLFGSCIIGSRCSLQDIMLNKLDTSCLFKDEPDEAAFTSFAEAVLQHSRSPAIEAKLVSDYMRVQPPFRSMVLSSIVSGAYTDGIEVLTKLTVPTFVAFGINESVVNPHYLSAIDFKKWQNKLFVLNNADHFVNIDQPEAINHLLKQFCGEVLEVNS